MSTGNAMRISLVTETFPPEVNGVARTLKELATGLMKRGHDLDVVRPHQGPGEDSAAAPPWTTRTVTGVPMGFYPGLRFGLPAPLALARRWNRHRPDVVHIATEGPLGLSALAMAKAMGVPICSSFHTNFHEYGDFYGYGGLRRLAVAFLRAFHNRTQRTLVPSPDVRDALDRRGFERLDLLGRGVDTELFSPTRRSDALRRSWGAGGDDVVAVFVSRLAREKNPALAARTFAELTRRVPGCRAVVVGDGPAMAEMRRRIPEAVFCGMRRGEDLAVHYASADLLLFPSLTETFGNVLTEGLASGLVPVAFDYAAAGLLV
ncbi:MAG: glycosyltransferase family 1 protein, partial [Acidobacteriota bacterium]